MSSIEIRKIGITKLDTDAVVNAANTGLWEGGGSTLFFFMRYLKMKNLGHFSLFAFFIVMV